MGCIAPLVAPVAGGALLFERHLQRAARCRFVHHGCPGRERRDSLLIPKGVSPGKPRASVTVGVVRGRPRHHSARDSDVANGAGYEAAASASGVSAARPGADGVRDPASEQRSADKDEEAEEGDDDQPGEVGDWRFHHPRRLCDRPSGHRRWRSALVGSAVGAYAGGLEALGREPTQGGACGAISSIGSGAASCCQLPDPGALRRGRREVDRRRRIGRCRCHANLGGRMGRVLRGARWSMPFFLHRRRVRRPRGMIARLNLSPDVT
jgi:hypothetical protein